MHANINNTKIFFDIMGGQLSPSGANMEKKESILLFPGAPLDHAYFRPYLDVLSNQFQVIYFDYRGTGRSEKCASHTWTHAQLVSDAISLLDYLGIDQAHIVGQSKGAHLALEFALQHPEKTSKLILINPPEVNPEAIKNNIREVVNDCAARCFSKTFENADINAFAEYMETVAPYLFSTPVDPALFGRIIMDVEFFVHTVKASLNYPLLDSLQQLQCPTLNIIGEVDLYNSKDFIGRVQAIHSKNIQSKVVAGAGHIAFIDKPQDCCKMILEFLGESRLRNTATP